MGCFVKYIIAALVGSHPKLRLKVEYPKPGSDFEIVRTLKEEQESINITNMIDLAICNGIKQESVIQTVMTENGLSRREVFRRIKYVRELRKSLHSIELEGGPHFPTDVPDGYQVAANGRLVPTDKA